MSDPAAPPSKNVDDKAAPMRVTYQLANGDTVTIENCTFESLSISVERARQWFREQGWEVTW